MKLLSFGEILFDVYPDACCLGGAPFNFAAHAALMGAESEFFSAVGDDDFGHLALESAKTLGVGTKYVKKLPDKETGKCMVSLDSNGVPSYNLLENVAYDFIPCPDFDKAEKFDVLSFGTLALRCENNFDTLKNVIAKNIAGEIYCDLNIRAPFYSEKSISFCMENATIIKISDEELPVVSKSVLGYTCDVKDAFINISQKFRGLKLIIITCGEKGAYAYDTKSRTLHYTEAVKTTVVSTVGAGDSFGAAFLTSYFDGCSIDKCLETAAKVSAYVCSCDGAIAQDMKKFVSELK